jgi:hypothetical protein
MNKQPSPKQAKKKKSDESVYSDEMSTALNAMNEKIVYVYERSRIAEVSPERTKALKVPVMDCYTFKNESYAPLRVGNKSVADEWIKWPGRRTADRIVYIPKQNRTTEDGNLNVWFPSTSISKKGDISLFHAYMNGIMENDPIYLDWVTAWLAYHLQHPTKKMLTGVMFWSHEQGNGKSTLGGIMRRIYGMHNSFLLRNKFPDRFNSYAENVQFGWIDELNRVKKTGQADDIKSMITQTRILIENKKEKPFEVPDIISYYFTSNHPNALDISAEDRRFFIHNVGKTSLTKDWFVKVFHPWIQLQSSIDAIHHYLLNEVDLTKPIIGGDPYSLNPAPFDPSSDAPRNASKLQAIEDNRDDVEAWLNELKESPDIILGDSQAHRTLFTSEELIELYRLQTKDLRISDQAFRVKMSGMLYKIGKNQAVRFPSGRIRVYSVNPADVKLNHNQIKDLWNKEHGSTVTGG